MHIENSTVLSNKLIAENTFLLELRSENLASLVKPGQFFNIKVTENDFPLLRRPFSISNVEGDSLFFMYKVVGIGTEIMANKKPGESLNLLGPLGNSFSWSGEYQHLFIVGGGIGIAPFPFLIKQINNNFSYSCLFGVRNINESHDYGLHNIKYSSDDGTIGFHGNVVELLDQEVNTINKKSKIFACGPNPMLRAIKKYAKEHQIQCEVSLESAMACGFGICQGCPIESNNENSYKLICKHGPIFNSEKIEL